MFDIFSGIPALPVTIIIVQHMPFSTTPRFAKRLSQLCRMNVIIPSDEELIKPESLYIAPGDNHLIIKDNQKILLTSTEKVNFVRPSIDVTMLSLRQDSRYQYTGIILSGMGCDGAEGLAFMKNLGAKTIVQDPETCIIRSMPESAIRLSNIDKILHPLEIRSFLLSLK
ncbi:MAG: chemotaxis protein CheB [Methanomicrobiales archaeon]|nr:chemotaxis protein CheB [Methanomicrobiales archaeon]